MKFFLGNKLPGLLSMIGGLLLWQAVSRLFLPTFLPSPLALLGNIASIFSKPAAYLVIGKTLERVFAGVILSMFIGSALGLVMGLRRSVGSFFDSWVMVLLTFPAISWAFLSVLWFGLSDIAPIFTVVLIVFPYVTMNVWEGTKALDKDLTAMAAVFQANRSLLLRRVMVPQLMPYIFSSLRISFALSWKIALVSEAFGAGLGVGKELTYWFQASRADMMLAWGTSFMALMVLIEMVVLRRWEIHVFSWRQPAAT
ncbi:MAG TPA: ABC transporter permease subunit [Candidatus Binatia bacterium]|nr:ABC transporter permease subunit [Candidatus Binatia bacterium]